MANSNKKFGEAFFAELNDDTYLHKIYEDILFNYSIKVFSFKKRAKRHIPKIDALTFADLLSKSNHSTLADSQKMWAQEIVTMLHYLYPDDPTVTYMTGVVLANLGNYQGQKLIDSTFDGIDALDRIFGEFKKDYLAIPADQGKRFMSAQKQVYDHLQDDYFSYSGPTSMGKSYIMRMFIKQQILSGSRNNFAIIVPTKALINEVRTKTTEDLGLSLKEYRYHLVTAAGDAALKIDDKSRRYVFIMTPERLLYLLMNEKDIQLDYLFIDEAQKLSGDDTRSPFYYQVVQILNEAEQKPHIIFASPNVPNPQVYLNLISGVETETLNLPADNLFITDFKNGLSHMSAIDFRNLIGRVGRLEYNLYGNVFLVAINEKASEKYVSRLQEEIPEQSLSVEKELTRPQKKHVIKTLLSGTIVIDKQLKSQSPDSYDLMRKFAIILLNDILKNRQSKVRSEFVALMQPGEEDKIRQLFSKKEVQPDDDITVSIDQTESLYEAITFNGLEFPQVDDNGEFDGKELLPFLERLCGIFKWERYESDTLGHVGKDSQKHGKLSWYSVILSQWVRGAGLNQIMFQAIDQKRKHPTNAMFDRTTRKYYDYTDTLRDRNDVISDVLNVIDKIILFKFSNYFLKVAKAYKEIRGQDPKDNWYEFVEYGSTNKRAIAIQKHGFSRESAMYILRQGQKYIAADEPELRLHRSILECPNKGVRNDADMIQYNIPDLFVD